MIVFMQVAINSRNERNPTEMHGRDHDDPVKARGHSFSISSTPNLEVSATNLLQRVGAGMSFRPLKAASAMVVPGQLWLALQASVVQLH